MRLVGGLGICNHYPMTLRCTYTGKEVTGPADAIWDDGEWISWDWINGQIEDQEDETEKQAYQTALRGRFDHSDPKDLFPNADPDRVRIFENLVKVTSDYKLATDRCLPVFGELGELFAEIAFGIDRHKPMTPGSDGRLGNDFIEIKTITPEKKNQKVTVKRQGNFNKLLVIRITEDFMFEARILDRKKMAKGTGKLATVSWSSMERISKKEDI
jgi:hypothetical protein